MNSWNGIGRLTKEPVVNYTATTQMAVARFTVAIDDGYGEKKRTNFIPIVVFGKQAENCEKYLHKGSMVGISDAKIQTGSYQDKDGKTAYTTDVVANKIEFINTGNKNAVSSENRPLNGTQEENIHDDFQAIDEDVPF